MVKNGLNSLENGFQLFGWYHLSWLMFTVLFIFFMYRIYSKLDLKKRKNIRILWASVIVILELIKNIILLWEGEFWYGSWPLHLCGLGIFIVLAHAFVKGHHVDMLLYCLTFPGALMALLTPEWTNTSAFNYLHFHSFIFHVLLFAYPMTMVLTNELQLSIYRIWQPIVFLCVVVPNIYALNLVWGTNFMYLNSAPAGTPLILLEQYAGKQYYILGFICLVIICWILLLLPVVFRKKR